MKLSQHLPSKTIIKDLLPVLGYVIVGLAIILTIMYLPFEVSNPWLWAIAICVLSNIICISVFLYFNKEKKERIKLMLSLMGCTLLFLLYMFLYKYGVWADLALFSIIGLIEMINFKISWPVENRPSRFFLYFNEIISVCTAIKYSSVLYYYHISCDGETPGVGHLMVALCALELLFFSAILLCVKNKNGEPKFTFLD